MPQTKTNFLFIVKKPTIRNLQLLAKAVVKSYKNGHQHSKMLGAGMEFSQYRSYQAGDDLRLLDWKLAARSQRFYVKQSETTKNMRVRFVLDASNSMNFAESAVSKLSYARFLIAILAYLAHQQGDEISVSAYDGEGLSEVVLKNRQQHLEKLFHFLEKIVAKGSWKNDEKVKHLFSQKTRKKELIIFLSDCYEKENEIFETLRQFQQQRHEVIVFHLVGKKEQTLDFEGIQVFEDLETKKRMAIHTKKARKQYVENLKNREVELKKSLQERQIFYQKADISQPFDVLLQSFIKRRNRLMY